jgi:hypothetical protein
MTALVKTYRPLVNLPVWRYDAQLPVAMAAGQCLAYDHRNNDDGSPFIYWLASNTLFHAYDPATAGLFTLASPALSGGFSPGACAVFHPSQGPRGTIAAGATTQAITLTTALPAAVAANQLANRGDGKGFVVRVIGNAAGSSGKIESRRVIANTAGTTPTLTLDTPLTFTPVLGDGYEFRSGRVFLLGAGALGAGIFKYYDVLTNSYSGSLATANLPATISTDTVMISLSESHVPWNRAPGSGFVNGAGTYDNGKNCIAATAATSTTITGSVMPADVGVVLGLQANEHRNFQVRIVEDATNPTAVNQRRRIASHTGGANAVFTVSAWTVTPSATAKFVIENDDDKIIARSSATASVYNYNVTANTWDTTTWAAAPAVHGAGLVFQQAFGVVPDVAKNARHSQVFCFRGGNAATLDVFDIAGAATGSWSADVPYGKRGLMNFNTGTCAAYDPATMEGCLLHINHQAQSYMMRFDMKHRILDVNTQFDGQQGAVHVGQRMANALYIDPEDPTVKQNFTIMVGASNGSVFSLATV